MFDTKKIGFLINPIAGMGGSVGLKGTDGLAHEAALKGAKPLAGERARACLRSIASSAPDILFLTAAGRMGEEALLESCQDCEVVYRTPQESSADDTREACAKFAGLGADLILFCGGDGTARDVAASSGDVPILGIPSGVKMHSGVFAISPEAAAELALGFVHGELKVRETEVVDVDEDLYRAGELQTRLYSVAKTPYKPALVQERKRIYASRDEEEFKDQIALFASEFMRDGSAYIVGAGTTTARIAEHLGLEKTLLGVDVIQNGKILMKDASEKDLLDLASHTDKVKIILSPIGAQGFILGRGNQQISSLVLRKVGIQNLIAVATPHKLEEIPYLLAYTGDEELDRMLSGKMRVVTGYRMAQLKELKAASMIDDQF